VKVLEEYLKDICMSLATKERALFELLFRISNKKLKGIVAELFNELMISCLEYVKKQ
jgi:hypothetical protein